MLDFFERQEFARKQTRRLILYFGLAVAGTIAALYLVAAWFFLSEGDVNRDWWDPELFLTVTILAALTITLGSSLKTFQLAKGGRVVAEMLGGKLVSTQTTDPEERRLLNVVEEMAIASGTPVPPVYVLEHEFGINAFAAGHDTSDCAIGVTRGCIHLLTRDELQGVIAHEFSHILNGDMALNMRLTCLAHGILFIALTGYWLLRLPGHLLLASSSSRHRERSGCHPGLLLAIIVAGFSLLVIGSIGVFFANLIKSAISRQREFLADAAAVQFTRNPAGIAGALKKIGGWVQGSRLHTPQAREASHFFFGDGVGGWFNWFATHPPLAQRIRLLDPMFTGNFRTVTDESAESLEAESDVAEAVSHLAGKPSAPMPSPQTANVAAVSQVSPAELMSFYADAAYVQRLREALPLGLRQAIRDPHGACAVVFLLLTSDEPEKRPELFQGIDPVIFVGLHAEMERLSDQVNAIPPGYRLSMVDLCLPALRALSSEQFTAFRRTLCDLIEADGTISLFEYALDKVLLRHLDGFFKGHPPTPVRYHALAPVLGEVVVLLSTLAYLNRQEQDGPRLAYEAGLRHLNIEGVTAPILPPEACHLAAVDQALEKLQGLAPVLKKNLLFAAGQVALSDGRLGRDEIELIRAIADVLGCPLPPFITEAPMEEERV